MRFGRAEEDAFINGTGIDVPTGILHATGGGEVEITLDGGVDFLLFLDMFPQIKNRDYPSGLEPDL